MAFRNVQLLLTINILHFLCFGLISPRITPHIVANGGNHIILGFLIAAVFICKKISRKILEFVENETKLLSLCVCSTFLTYLILVFSNVYWVICLDRCVFALTDEIRYFSKKNLLQYRHFFHIIDTLNVAAMATGAILGGYIVDFSHVAVLASILAFLNIVLVQYVKETPIKARKNEERTVQMEFNWLNLVFILISGIFFTRFAFLLRFKFHLGDIVIGYTVAYQWIVTYLCKNLANFLNDYITNKQLLFEWNLVIFGFSLVALFYAPTYEFYLFIYVAMILSYSFIRILIEGNQFEDIVNILGPVCFGFFAHFYGGQAFKMFTVLPCVVGGYLIKQKFSVLKNAKSKTE